MDEHTEQLGGPETAADAGSPYAPPGVVPSHWRAPAPTDGPADTDAPTEPLRGTNGPPTEEVPGAWVVPPPSPAGGEGPTWRAAGDAPPAPPFGPVPVPATAPAAAPVGPARANVGWLLAAVALVAALVGAGVGAGVAAWRVNGDSTEHVTQLSTGPALLNGTTTIGAVVAKVLPAVVSIDAQSSGQSFGGFGGSTTQEDQGTGMIITPDGEVVTNNHVIAGASTITVTLYGQTKALPATLIDTDASNDVALLQITGAHGLPTVAFDNSDHIQVADGVVAIGNALGLSQGTPTVTQGIISAKGRSVQAQSETGATETLTNMLQTDAAINPGNSGGPLADSNGRVIGMNTAVASSGDGSSQAQNIGFAIPSNTIQGLVPELRSHSIGGGGADGPAYLGVNIETLTPDLRSQYNFVPQQGAIVISVSAGSPAAGAGLQQGDVIVSFDGTAITGADQLATLIQADKPGQKATIGIYRGANQQTLTATLGSDTTSGAPSG